MAQLRIEEYVADKDTPVSVDIYEISQKTPHISILAEASAVLLTDLRTQCSEWLAVEIMLKWIPLIQEHPDGKTAFSLDVCSDPELQRIWRYHYVP